MRYGVTLVVGLLFLLPSGCITPPISPVSSINPDKGIDLLVALEPSAFKELLALKIGVLAEQRGLETRIVDVRELPRESLKNYRAAIIINSVWAGRHRSHVRKFLAGLTDEERRRTVLVNTARVTSWKTTEPRVHAITCASQMNRLDDVLVFLNDRLDRILAEDPKRTTDERTRSAGTMPAR